MKEYAKKFYKSKAWRKCRDSFYVSKHGLCMKCGRPGKIVHHKKYITPNNINNPNVTLNFDNLELLCQDCHTKLHMKKNNAMQSDLMFDKNGNLIKKYKK